MSPAHDPAYWPVFGSLLATFAAQVTSTFYDCPHSERPCCRCELSPEGCREVTHFPHVLRCWARTRRRRRRKAA